MRVIRHRNRLLREVIDISSPELFKARVLNNLAEGIPTHGRWRGSR